MIFNLPFAIQVTTLNLKKRLVYFFGRISSECSAHNSEVRLKVEPVFEYTYAHAIKVSSETCFAF